MNRVHEFIRSLPAQQQPDWAGNPEIQRVREELGTLPPLVTLAETDALRAHLAEAAAGRVQVVQSGDCAEDWDEATPSEVARKSGLLDMLAGSVRMTAHRPVLRVGRMAGQFAKPRSRPTEVVSGAELPVYRGHMVNSPEPDPRLRCPDPRRLLRGYRAAADVLRHLGWPHGSAVPGLDARVWTSHEALLLDYELPQLHRQPDGRLLLTSTHWPWIGERTRQVDGAHAALLAAVANPVSCKVGPAVTADELLALCERLDPDRVPGRLTLIARMGGETVAALLPGLVAAVRAAGHPVIWLTDPMHGNTVTTDDGFKTRLVESIVREVEDFHTAVTESGGTAGGLHLETTPDEVTECVTDRSEMDRVSDKYTSLCDPRLNPRQAVAVASAWRG
ncbi:3-deoxy-7-phosphoheptulonate synthase [Streptomyces synnematoformans]|uniref:Phospho-2-dehydro-3-deoxyheptonate aldolase n=1 Tax=Streptomyces synnematoformans TaxID=415721 RepID=A0ABN2X784_9ACTN